MYPIYIYHISDRASPEGRAKVEKAQWTVTQVLYRMIQRNHKKPSVVFGNCMRVLSEERSVSVALRDYEEEFWLQWGDKLDFPSLLLEMII